MEKVAELMTGSNDFKWQSQETKTRSLTRGQHLYLKCRDSKKEQVCI